MIWNENKDETVGIERIWLNEIGKERIEYVQIVRCKDCVHGRVYAPNCVDCELNELAKDEDWFCADGKRRENT